MMSFPLRERGLKLLSKQVIMGWLEVVPLAGTWIETSYRTDLAASLIPSFPLRERGLKRLLVSVSQNFLCVVPLAGTWIETETDQ